MCRFKFFQKEFKLICMVVWERVFTLQIFITFRTNDFRIKPINLVMLEFNLRPTKLQSCLFSLEETIANKRRSSSSLVVLFGSNTIVPLSRTNLLETNSTTTTTRPATTTTKKTVTTTTTAASTATTVFSGSFVLQVFSTYPS